MAHDFSILTQDDKEYYFFGLAEGRLYDVFDARDRHAGVSGDGSTKDVKRGDFIKELAGFCAWIRESYPDPSRADELQAFIDETTSDSDEQLYSAYFG